MAAAGWQDAEVKIYCAGEEDLLDSPRSGREAVRLGAVMEGETRFCSARAGRNRHDTIHVRDSSALPTRAHGPQGLHMLIR